MFLRVCLTRIGHASLKPLSGPLRRRHVQQLSRHTSQLAQRVCNTKPPELEAYFARLRAANDVRNLNDIHTSYSAVLESLKNAKHPAEELGHYGLSVQLLAGTLETLATSGRPGDQKLLHDIVWQMEDVFGIKPTPEIYGAVLDGFLEHGNGHGARNWLRSMPRKPGSFIPTIEQWHRLLEKLTEDELQTFKFIHNCVKDMSVSGCKPTVETYKLLVRARWRVSANNAPHVVVFTTIIDEMQKEGLPYDNSFAALIYDCYSERGRSGDAVAVERYYRSRFPDTVSDAGEKARHWSERLSRAAQSGGVRTAVAVFNALQEEGCMASPPMIAAMLKHAASTSDIRSLEKSFNIEATVAHWSIVMSNVVRTGNTPRALAVYSEAKAAGIKPDAGLVGPLLGSLCQRTVSRPAESSIDHALVIYRELRDAAPPPVESDSPQKSAHSAGPDSRIYHTLLRALASSSNQAKYFPLAMELLDDMENRRVATDDSVTVTSTIVLLMRNASTLDDAFKAYQRLRHGLDEKGYSVVLHEFCALSFDQHHHLPSLPRYFQMVKDMRLSGLPLTPQVYTILLRQLGIIATRMTWQNSPIPSGIGDELVIATRRAHDLLTLDASMTPDAACLNQLMDTYQRLGCFGDSYRVWEMMYFSHRFDHISVSIMLDACGHAGASQVAYQIKSRLAKDNFRLNQRNWNAWVECLCRLGNLNAAVKVVCLEMGKQQTDVAPDAETVKILLSFVKNKDLRAEVLGRIEQFLPELWTSLPGDLRTS